MKPLTRRSLRVLLVVAVVVSQAQAHAHVIDLDDIVEIKGYHPPDRPAPVDLKDSALRTFLSGYVAVRNDDVVASAFSSSSARAVFKNEERGVTFMYAACPWETANLGMITGPPHMIVFVVDAEFVMFQLRELCRRPPPGFTPRR